MNIQYCLYLVLDSYDEEHLVTKILKMNPDYQTWEHYQKAGFHFQLTKWSRRNFSFDNIVRYCARASEHTPDIISTSQLNPGDTTVSFQSYKFDQIADQLERRGLSPIRGVYRGYIARTLDLPDENTAIKASDYIMGSKWYLVKVSRHPIDKVVQVESNAHVWRTAPSLF